MHMQTNNKTKTNYLQEAKDVRTCQCCVNAQRSLRVLSWLQLALARMAPVPGALAADQQAELVLVARL